MPAGGDFLISSSAGEMLGTNNQEPASLPVKQDSPTAPPVEPEQGVHRQVRRRLPQRADDPGDVALSS